MSHGAVGAGKAEPAGVLAIGAVGPERLGPGADFMDISKPAADQVEEMGAEVGGDTSARFELPGGGVGSLWGRGSVRREPTSLGQRSPQVMDASEGFGLEELGDQGEIGAETEREIDHVNDAGLGGGLGHEAGFLGAGGQGFFAQDMFAGRDGGQHGFLVKWGRGANKNGLGRGIEQGGDTWAGLDMKGCGHLFGGLGLDIMDGAQLERAGGGLEAGQVEPTGDIAGANQGDGNS